MYALPNKTQHKFLVKVRGGISQKLDNFTSSQPTTSNNSQQFQVSSPLKQTASLSSNSASTSLSRESALNRHIDEAGFGAELNYSPQPVFHSVSQNGSKQKSSSYQQRAQKQYITPEHNEMIKYVQQSWKGVERDYKKSVNNFINNIDLNGSSDHLNPAQLNQKQAKKKAATASTPLLLSGSYHHSAGRDLGSTRQDSFQPFDLEAFWGNRILKRLTEEL